MDHTDLICFKWNVTIYLITGGKKDLDQFILLIQVFFIFTLIFLSRLAKIIVVIFVGVFWCLLYFIGSECLDVFISECAAEI